MDCAKYLAKISAQKLCILMFYYWPWQMLYHLITVLICIIYALPRCLLLWFSMSRPFIKTCTFKKHKCTMLRFICHPFPPWFSLIWSLAPVLFHYAIQYCTILGTSKDFPADLQWRMQNYSKHSHWMMVLTEACLSLGTKLGALMSTLLASDNLSTERTELKR